MITPNLIFYEELRECNEGKEANKPVIRSLPEHVQRRMVKQKKDRAAATDLEEDSQLFATLEAPDSTDLMEWMDSLYDVVTGDSQDLYAQEAADKT